MLTTALKRIARLLLLLVVIALALLMFFQSKLIYFPPAAAPEDVKAFLDSGGKRLDYVTSQGRQTAWLRLASGGRAAERLWIVCAGNGSQGLDLADLQHESGLPNDAFLLMDYPGYGLSQGRPSPSTIRENLLKAVPLAAAAAGLSSADLATRGLAFGHSLGCGATLLGAEAFGLKRAVLLAPFTSTMEMTRVMLHAPLGWLVTHRFNNRARLAELKTRGGHAWIFNGSRDDTIPPRMGRTLAEELGPAATYCEILGADHNDLLQMAGPQIYAAMHAARDLP